MLAYRHAFHAGNHADVLKHIVLMLVLRHMNAKPKPYRYVDTHGGAGGYSLEGRYAQKKGEYEAASAASGPATTCRRRWPTTSRWCAASIRMACSPSTRDRRHWRRCCCGLMTSCAPSSFIPTEQKILRATLAATPGAIAYDGDGFAGLKSQLPPSSRRAAVLIDPSYEGNADYGRVVATLREALARFAPGVYMVWYPQVSKLEAASCPSGSRRWRPRAGCMPASACSSPMPRASAWRAAGCS